MEEKKTRRKLDKGAALEQMRTFCAYQDRCHKEVRTRLLEYQVYGDDLEQIIAELITDDFLNEERFARSYARGKFRMKKWGRNKIRQELKLRQVSDYLIKIGIAEIDEQEYLATLEELLQKKMQVVREADAYRMSKKLTDYAAARGYEYAVIKEVLQGIL